MTFTGKLFPPRGLSGLTNLISNEIKAKTWFSNLDAIKSLSKLPKLRVPQSIWVPLVKIDECTSIDQFEAAVQSIDFAAIPSMKSVGLRVSQSREVMKFSPVSELTNIVLHALPEDLKENEFSVHINDKNELSIQTNLIPPRPWILIPQKMEPQPEWWSVNDKQTTPTMKVSDLAIKEFRNESSLACLSAALVIASNLSAGLKRKHLGEETLIWDPFVGNGSVVLEVVSFLADSPFLNRTVTIVGNVITKESGQKVEQRLRKLCESIGTEISAISEAEEKKPDAKSGGRKSRKSEQAEHEISDERMRSFHMHLPNGTNLTVHLAHTSFEEVFPFISGALILTHIPKGYSEMLGIDKRTLSDWTAFGNLIKTNRKFEMFVFAESLSFYKYTKLKFSKFIHLVSPNGSQVGNISKWVGF